MNGPEQHKNHDHASILEQIRNDRIDIGTMDGFKPLLEAFPENPDLYRKYADRLAAANQPEAALVAYHRAAGLYLEAGMVLQSIVAKILAWSIVKPSHREGRDFHAKVRRMGGGDVPSQLFFPQLRYEEMVALMLRLTRIRLAPGTTVYDVGQEATQIYFIVSGELTETPPQTKDGQPSDAIALAENDIFGDIFPLEEASYCRARVATTSAVEMVKMSKPVLKAACYRYPRIRERLERLSRVRTPQDSDRIWKTVRRSCRYCLPADVKLELAPKNPAEKRVLHGSLRDLSTGGICVALKNDFPPPDSKFQLKENTTLTILEGNRTVINHLTGKVAWRTTVGSSSHPIHIVGIAFNQMAEETAIALNAFCTISNDEQDMIWNLWNHLVRP
ncbi:PilZ domain-containing protein [Desulfosarcina sp.]|uniref:PilZ domain-containing protein n=1 Tax=Desulfosarcina sp. TaxID=2027861 RepID=UPI0039707568